jgi:hypothetical protein
MLSDAGINLIMVIATALVPASATSGAVTPPVFASVQVSVTVSTKSDMFIYVYSAANQPTNTLVLKGVDLDLKSAGSVAAGAPFRGTNGFCLLDDRNGFAAWGPGESNRTPPGMAFTGFGLESPGPPTIRRMIVQPYLLDYMRAVREDREARGEELSEEESRSIERPYILVVKTLGPLAVPPGSLEHWETFLADVAQAGQLGWISNASLLAAIRSEVNAARQALLAEDVATARAHLQAVVATIQQSTPLQRSEEAHALVLLNAEALLRSLHDR